MTKHSRLFPFDSPPNHVYTYCIYNHKNGDMFMSIAKVFQSGNSQAIRIPKEMQTNQSEFIIRKINNCYFLVPTDDPWALLRQVFEDTSDDIIFDRDQPLSSELTEREEF